MYDITFYPLGNADTSLVELENGATILFDYAHVKCSETEDDKRCNLHQELNDAITKDYIDVVCFTHLDKDHVVGAKDFFYLNHSILYQGRDRKKINELWVPAEAITESKNSCNEDAKIIQSEARYRLKRASGIKVFSRPRKLKEWCDKNEGYDFEKIKHLIVDAGEIVPTFSLEEDGVEVFAHCPFYSESRDVDRNGCAIVVHLTFNNFHKSKIMMGSDIPYDVWENIVNITEAQGRTERLTWDVFHISHHCSYKSLAKEKGATKTEVSETINRLYDDYSNEGAFLISPSKPIPVAYGPAEGEQPPHKQAYNYYNQVENSTVKVTMEEPTIEEPKPIKLSIGNSGVTLNSVPIAYISTSTPSSKPPRAGVK